MSTVDAIKLGCVIAVAGLIVPMSEAATPMPKVHHEWSVHIIGKNYGFFEEDRFLSRTVSTSPAVLAGRQIRIQAGPYSAELPGSLWVYGLGTGAVILAGALYFLRSNSQNRIP